MTQWWEIDIPQPPGEEPKLRAVAYYRHSALDRQENSIPIQQEQVREWAQKNGVEIIHEFADAGKPGLTAEDRPAFTRVDGAVGQTAEGFYLHPLSGRQSLGSVSGSRPVGTIYCRVRKARQASGRNCIRISPLRDSRFRATFDVLSERGQGLSPSAIAPFAIPHSSASKRVGSRFLLFSDPFPPSTLDPCYDLSVTVLSWTTASNVLAAVRQRIKEMTDDTLVGNRHPAANRARSRGCGPWPTIATRPRTARRTRSRFSRTRSANGPRRTASRSSTSSPTPANRVSPPKAGRRSPR